MNHTSAAPRSVTATRRGPAGTTVGSMAAAIVALFVIVAVTPVPARADTAAGAMTFTPDALSFSASRQTQTITLTNTGPAPVALLSVQTLSFNNIAVPDFKVEPVAPRMLPPGGAVSVRVAFEPAHGTMEAIGALLAIVDGQPSAARDEGQDPVPVQAGSAALRALAPAGPDGILTWVWLSSLLGLLLVVSLPPTVDQAARIVGRVAGVMPLIMAGLACMKFDPVGGAQSGNWGLQLIERLVIAPGLGLEYYLAVDGIGLLLVTVTTAAGALAALMAPAATGRRVLAIALAVQTGVSGLLVAQDVLLLALFWALAVGAVAALTAASDDASPRTLRTAQIRAMTSALLVAVGMLLVRGASGATALGDGTAAAHIGDLPRLIHHDSSPVGGVHGVAWALLFVGFALATPLAPFHRGLVDAAGRDRTPPALLLLVDAVLGTAALGTFARVLWPLLHGVTRDAAGWAAGLGALSIVWGALAASGETAPRRLVARLGSVRAGVILLGLAGLSRTGMSAVVLLLVASTFGAALAWLGVALEATPAGSVARVRRIGARVALSIGVGTLTGAPGTPAFVGQLLVVMALVPVSLPLAGAAALAIVLQMAVMVGVARVWLTAGAAGKVAAAPGTVASAVDASAPATTTSSAVTSSTATPSVSTPSAASAPLVAIDVEGADRGAHTVGWPALAAGAALAAITVALGVWPEGVVGTLADAIADLAARVGDSLGAVRLAHEFVRAAVIGLG